MVPAGNAATGGNRSTGQATVQSVKGSDMHVKLVGMAFAPDLQAAQTDVLNVYRATEVMCPEVVQTSLTPIKPQPPVAGQIQQPFTIDLDLALATRSKK